MSRLKQHSKSLSDSPINSEIEEVFRACKKWGVSARLRLPGGTVVDVLFSEEQHQPFIPDATQKGILKALDGKAMKTTQLGQAIGDKSRLYKKGRSGVGCIKELENEGLVAYHDRLGYYRPDKPPPELKEVPAT
jgi:hypothetical protein